MTSEPQTPDDLSLHFHMLNNIVDYIYLWDAQQTSG